MIFFRKSIFLKIISTSFSVFYFPLDDISSTSLHIIVDISSLLDVTMRLITCNNDKYYGKIQEEN